MRMILEGQEMGLSLTRGKINYMNIYFACASEDIRNHLQEYKLITKIIIDLGHNIPENWLERIDIKGPDINTNEAKKKELLRKEGIESVKTADLLVAEISQQSVGVGYQIATAMDNKIPVLCLITDEINGGKPSQIIESSNSPLVTIREYKKSNVREIIKDYFRRFSNKSLIKFNFIITPEIDKYLNWKSRNGKLSKSEILRKLIMDHIIVNDLEYKDQNEGGH